jgi:hypothetical protein
MLKAKNVTLLSRIAERGRNWATTLMLANGPPFLTTQASSVTPLLLVLRDAKLRERQNFLAKNARAGSDRP